MPGDIAIDMTGFRSGKLKVLAPAKGRQKKRAYWLCRCDCGGLVVVMGKYLRGREVKSCGCLNRQPLDGKPHHFKHGHTAKGMVSSTYKSWMAMISRCKNPATKKYYRGVTVCKRWLDFRNFLADMGERPKGRSIDRYPNRSGNYELGNCRWATAKEQANNRRKQSR